MMDKFFQAALGAAKKSLEEGGIPIGSALVIDGVLVGIGHNKRQQEHSPILHAEMDCLANAGLLDAVDYQRSTIYTTLSPCEMCSGAILLYGIPKVVIGENRNFRGPEEHLLSRGVALEVLDDSECFRIMDEFRRAYPRMWSQDIGQTWKSEA